MIIAYKPRLKKFSRQLRNHSTLSEVLLWQKINRRQLGLLFNRQKPIDEYIVDFYCAELALAIEIDGSTHFEKEKYDDAREQKLNESNITVLRFSDSQVKNNLHSVVEEIKEWIKKKKFLSGR